jgi:tetratricopeptide (TPR) repeat protein
MIVVDTGSKDKTPQIAQKFGARVFHFPWPDSFAIARNESLRYARGRWIFWMDSDDTIDSANGARLREVIRQIDPSVLGIIMAVHCPGPGEEAEHELTVATIVKLFRNLPQLRFEGRIHEQILGAIRRAKGKVVWSDLFVVHSGYDYSSEGQKKKKERDLHLLHLELQEQPDHPFTLFNLGRLHSNFGEHQEAVACLTHSIQNSEKSEPQLPKAYALLVHCHLALGHWEAAWDACHRGLRHFPRDVELHFRKGILLHGAQRFQEALQAYQSVLDIREDDAFFSYAQGIKSYITRLNMAVVYRNMGDLTRAEAQLRRVVEEVPRYRLGWRGLGEVLVSAGKLEEAAQIQERLLADSRLHFEGVLLASQLAVRRGDIASARHALERAIKKYPNELPPLQAICRVLFEHGELGDAEQALRELARRDPQDAATLHNLGVVCSRQGKLNEANAAFQESLRLRSRQLGLRRN